MRIVVVLPHTSYTQRPDEYVYYEFSKPWPANVRPVVRSALPRDLKDTLKIDPVSMDEMKADITRNGDPTSKSWVNKDRASGTYFRIWGGVAGAWFTLEVDGQPVKIHVSSLP